MTGPDGTASNTVYISPPLQLLVSFVQSTVRATAMGSSVTFTETNGAGGSGTGIAMIQAGLSSPPSGTLLTGAAGSISPIPVKVGVGSVSGGGVQGVEVHIVSDSSLPATATCVTSPGNQPGSVLTDASGNAVCNLQFGSVTGQGRIRVYIGNKYSAFGPFIIQVSAGSTSPSNPGVQLTVAPASLNFTYPGGVTSQTVSVGSTGSAVTYTASVQVTLAAVSWLSVGLPSGPASSTAASSLPISVIPQSLASGTYSAIVALHPSNGTADVTIPVQLTVGGTTP